MSNSANFDFAQVVCFPKAYREVLEVASLFELEGVGTLVDHSVASVIDAQDKEVIKNPTEVVWSLRIFAKRVRTINNCPHAVPKGPKVRQVAML